MPADHESPLNILFVSPECAPWVKTGGLGDVSGALSKALMRLGHEVRVLIPAIRSLTPLLAQAEQSIVLPAHGHWPSVRLALVRQQGMALWLLDCPGLYDRPGGPYLDEHGQDHGDNVHRFGLLSHVGALLSSPDSPWPDWPVDVLHCHDWTAGLAPAYLSRWPARKAVSVMTIHNLAFQGMFPAYNAAALDLPEEWMSTDGVLHWDQVCFLKAGLRFADAITAVSPTYAREIQQEAHGCGLDGMLRWRSRDLVGILNGIDTEVWNPAGDELIPTHYDAETLALKARNKAALQKRMGLRADPHLMVLGVVSRLTEQKGIDLILHSLPEILAQGCQLCVLGKGDAPLERALLEASAAHHGDVGVHLGFDENLAHLIEAGADAFLMPSRFEPCGLNQMYSQRYGTPPIVRAVGGLADSVKDQSGQEGTGFVFDEATPESFLHTVTRARKAYGDRALWSQLQRNAMAEDFGWEVSARQYVDVYRRHARQG